MDYIEIKISYSYNLRVLLLKRRKQKTCQRYSLLLVALNFEAVAIISLHAVRLYIGTRGVISLRRVPIYRRKGPARSAGPIH